MSIYIHIYIYMPTFLILTQWKCWAVNYWLYQFWMNHHGTTFALAPLLWASLPYNLTFRSNFLSEYVFYLRLRLSPALNKSSCNPRTNWRMSRRCLIRTDEDWMVLGRYLQLCFQTCHIHCLHVGWQGS